MEWLWQRKGQTSMYSPFPNDIPGDTRRIGEAILQQHDICRFLGDHVEEILESEDFAGFYAEGGRPGVHPLMLVMVTILQFWEDLPDRKASEQVVKRIDWKYALRQELTWMGFHFSDLCHFRQRLLNHEAGHVVFEKVLAYLLGQGYLKKRGKQRTDSTHVLGQVSRLSQVELKWESLRMALSDLMTIDAVWTREQIGLETVERYSQARASYRLSKAKLEALEREVETEGIRVLRQIEEAGRPEWRQLRYVSLLYAVFRQQVKCFSAETWDAWENTAADLPTGEILSPHEPEARYAEKRKHGWVGYKTHVTESFEEDGTHFITDTLVTLAQQHDSVALKRIQDRLIARDVCPGQQYVDTGYMSAEHIDESAKRGIDLRGKVQADASCKTEGFRLQDFEVDMQRQVATCPMGKQSVRWRAVTGTANVAFRASFGRTCRTCPHFTNEACTTLPSGRRLDINAHHDTLQARRREQMTPAFRQEMHRRAAVEGLISEAVRVHDLRHNRYRGLEKTQFQSDFTAVSINLKRLMSLSAA